MSATRRQTNSCIDNTQTTAVMQGKCQAKQVRRLGLRNICPQQAGRRRQDYSSASARSRRSPPLPSLRSLPREPGLEYARPGGACTQPLTRFIRSRDQQIVTSEAAEAYRCVLDSLHCTTQNLSWCVAATCEKDASMILLNRTNFSKE